MSSNANLEEKTRPPIFRNEKSKFTWIPWLIIYLYYSFQEKWDLIIYGLNEFEKYVHLNIPVAIRDFFFSRFSEIFV